jgi:hypothetical protein
MAAEFPLEIAWFMFKGTRAQSMEVAGVCAGEEEVPRAAKDPGSGRSFRHAENGSSVMVGLDEMGRGCGSWACWTMQAMEDKRRRSDGILCRS